MKGFHEYADPGAFGEIWLLGGPGRFDNILAGAAVVVLTISGLLIGWFLFVS